MFFSECRGPRYQVKGHEIQVQCSGFFMWLRAQGSGLRVQGSGFSDRGLKFLVQGSGFEFQGSGFEVQGLRITKSAGTT